MWIKCLAQGNNILLPRFEPSTSVSKIDILANRPICSYDHISNVNVGYAIGRCDHGTITFNISLHPISEEGKFKSYLYDKGKYKEISKRP